MYQEISYRRFQYFIICILALQVTFIPPTVLADKAPEAIEQEEVDDELGISDPLEGWNRAMFWVNNQLDTYLLEPVAICYDTVMPEPAQTGVRNFFNNVQYPVYLLSDVLQFKFEQAGEHTARFLINTTLGVGGLIDVAKHLGFERHQEDLGTALAHHGVGAGPYIMVPILGPTTVRDGLSGVVDGFITPTSWMPYQFADDDDAFLIALGFNSLNVVQTRTDLLDAIDAAKEASVDYYLFVQSAYYQRRKAIIEDRFVDPVEGEEEDPFAEDEAFDAEFGE